MTSNECGWLIEWPADDNVPVRWWHPVNGWMRDASKGVRFSRKQDAEAYISAGKFCSPVVATEHAWGFAPETSPKPINQCDGCRRGLPVEEGIHTGPGGFWKGDVQACTAHLYQSAEETSIDGCRYPMSGGRRCDSYPNCVCGDSPPAHDETSARSLLTRYAKWAEHKPLCTESADAPCSCGLTELEIEAVKLV